MEFEHTTTDFRWGVLTNWAIRSWVQLALRAKFVQLLQFHLFVQCRISFRPLSSSVATFILIESLLNNHMSVAEWPDTYGIHSWRILWSIYRKLIWVGFEPTFTEFRSDALTEWVIKPWVQLALRANFVQLLQFRLFVQCRISFRLLPSSVNTFILIESLLR